MPQVEVNVYNSRTGQQVGHDCVELCNSNPSTRIGIAADALSNHAAWEDSEVKEMETRKKPDGRDYTIYSIKGSQFYAEVVF